MSRTLFRYIFWDLFKIFMITNGVLSGIMSFAGLLRPLTQNGLDAGQVGRLLTYFTPSMMAYSFPIAALFAGTVVYGRMNTDNEVIACRAGGISHLSIALPGIVLGLLVAMISLAFLCFVVPYFTLKVEKVIYSNLAQLVANKIERNHQIKSDASTVFAQHATVSDPDPSKPREQSVVLDGPTIITYERPDKNKPTFRVPTEFWMARKATLYINTEASGDKGQMTVVLEGGLKFPRHNVGGWEGGVEATQFGPTDLDSQIHEDTKFMNITRLKELDADKSKSRTILKLLKQFIADDQENQYLQMMQDPLQSEARQCKFVTGKDRYVISIAGDEQFSRKAGHLVIDAVKPETRTVRLVKYRDGAPVLDVNADEIRLRGRADNEDSTMNVSMEMYNLALHEPDGDVIRGGPVSQDFAVAMPASLKSLSQTKPQWYGSAEPNASGPRHQMERELRVLNNNIASEIHMRLAFAVSCLILAMMGCCLGLMFRTGNYLSAFAISFFPAMLCITMIIAGQRTASNIPQDHFWNYHDPLRMGLCVLWSGNALVMLLAGGLLVRLQRR